MIAESLTLPLFLRILESIMDRVLDVLQGRYQQEVTGIQPFAIIQNVIMVRWIYLLAAPLLHALRKEIRCLFQARKAI